MIDKKKLAELCKKNGTTKYRLGIEMYGADRLHLVYKINNPTQKMLSRIYKALKNISKNNNL